MFEPAFDETEACHAFQSWIGNNDTWRQGSGSPNANPEHGETSDASYRYIPMSVLRREFTKPKIKRLLDAVFARSDRAAPDAETIIKHYLRPFLILVHIGRGSQILRFVKQDNLKDDCLPFQTLPHGLPESTDWFHTFCEKQWQFYPVPFSYNMDRDLSTRHILPLKYIRTLGGGGSAITYQVRIDTEYNGLRQSDPRELVRQTLLVSRPSLMLRQNILERNRDVYVIKSYRTHEAQDCYETECNGFRKLRQDSKPPANIIAFYGNFMWGSSRNILLEYADCGTLKDYMKDKAPPVRAEDIERFWNNVLALLDGLLTIHGKDYMRSGKHKFMIG
ncbi:MAG: hypothetical protein OHK93_003749 [Ramalina farinacea]|uniref:Protein kinase domain-containing protein n=1 Tax=Ramalina farinacea TaxID=258253 RepID=A0AA43QTY6_9LECA|nr:hypothetical protein [Ramalina farinacea]